jgi:hypothetical protein
MGQWVGAAVGGVTGAYTTAAQVRAKNKAAIALAEGTAKADQAIATSSFQTISRINVERAAARHQVQNTLVSIQESGLAATGTSTANAAATNQTGASVNAVLSDLQGKAAAAQATVLENNGLNEARLDNSLNDTVNSALRSFRGSTLNNAISERDATTLIALGGHSGAMQGMGWGSVDTKSMISDTQSTTTASQSAANGTEFLSASEKDRRDAWDQDMQSYQSNSSGGYNPGGQGASWTYQNSDATSSHESSGNSASVIFGT